MARRSPSYTRSYLSLRSPERPSSLARRGASTILPHLGGQVWATAGVASLFGLALATGCTVGAVGADRDDKGLDIVVPDDAADLRRSFVITTTGCEQLALLDDPAVYGGPAETTFRSPADSASASTVYLDCDESAEAPSLMVFTAGEASQSLPAATPGDSPTSVTSTESSDPDGTAADIDSDDPRAPNESVPSRSEESDARLGGADAVAYAIAEQLTERLGPFMDLGQGFTPRKVAAASVPGSKAGDIKIVLGKSAIADLAEANPGVKENLRQAIVRSINSGVVAQTKPEEVTLAFVVAVYVYEAPDSENLETATGPEYCRNGEGPGSYLDMPCGTVLGVQDAGVRVTGFYSAEVGNSEARRQTILSAVSTNENGLVQAKYRNPQNVALSISIDAKGFEEHLAGIEEPIFRLDPTEPNFIVYVPMVATTPAGQDPAGSADTSDPGADDTGVTPADPSVPTDSVSGQTTTPDPADVSAGTRQPTETPSRQRETNRLPDTNLPDSSRTGSPSGSTGKQPTTSGCASAPALRPFFLLWLLLRPLARRRRARRQP